MKLPISLLLYGASVGLFGAASWSVYTMLPLLNAETRQAAIARGQKGADSALTRVKGQTPPSAEWQYGADWWADFKTVNLRGALPPKPVEEVQAPAKVEERAVELPPVHRIVELISLVYDGQEGGRGGNTHVIVRYLPEANVQPPEWYLREMPTAAAGAAPMAAAPRDAVPGRPPRPATLPVANASRPAPGKSPTPMPTSLIGREIVQKIWIQSDGDPRRVATLWPPFDDIRLVRVAPDAQTAFFTRTPQKQDGEATPPPPVEEEVIKSSLNLSQDVLRELRRVQGMEMPRADKIQSTPQAKAGVWMDVEETTQVGNVRHIGRADARRMQNSDEVFDSVHFDTYVSTTGNTRGLIVKRLDPQLSARFGIQASDVLLEVNNRAVQTKEQALQFGKSEYRKGVRTFTTKWLSNGQVVERVYQAQDR
jgi:hypothetical protein